MDLKCEWLHSVYRWQYRTRVELERLFLPRPRDQGKLAPVRINLSEIKKILLVVNGLIGDTVMCTPAISQLRRAFPAAQIDALTNPHVMDLLKPSMWVDSFYVYAGSPFPLLLSRFFQLKEIKRQISAVHYDLAIILLGDHFAPLLYKCNIPPRVGVDYDRFSYLMTHRYSIGEIRNWGPNERLNVLRLLGIQPEDMFPILKVSAEAKSKIKKLIPMDKATVAFHPFGASASRCLSREKIRSLIQRLIQELNVNVVLIGGLREMKQSRSLGISSQHFFNYVGQFNLQETCALIAQADIMLSTDSGPLHLAGALGKLAVGLFRAIRPEYAHLYASVTPLFWRAPQNCLPGCHWDSAYGCRQLPCRQLEEISNDAIIETIETLISKKSCSPGGS